MKSTRIILVAIVLCSFFAVANAQQSKLQFDDHLRIYNGVNKVFKSKALFTWDGKNKATMSHDGELLFRLTLRNRKLEYSSNGRYLAYDAYEAIDDEEWKVYLYESGRIELVRSSSPANLFFLYDDSEYEKTYKYYQ